jgi:hypothetical protein
MKRQVLVFSILLIMIWLGVMAMRPTYYYRYHYGHVYAGQFPAIMSGVRGEGPYLEFKIPFFCPVGLWKPSARQIREALAAAPGYNQSVSSG